MFTINIFVRQITKPPILCPCSSDCRLTETLLSCVAPLCTPVFCNPHPQPSWCHKQPTTYLQKMLNEFPWASKSAGHKTPNIGNFQHLNIMEMIRSE